MMENSKSTFASNIVISYKFRLTVLYGERFVKPNVMFGFLKMNKQYKHLNTTLT